MEDKMFKYIVKDGKLIVAIYEVGISNVELYYRGYIYDYMCHYNGEFDDEKFVNNFKTANFSGNENQKNLDIDYTSEYGGYIYTEDPYYMHKIGEITQVYDLYEKSNFTISSKWADSWIGDQMCDILQLVIEMQKKLINEYTYLRKQKK